MVFFDDAVTEERPHLGQLNLVAQGSYRRVLFVCSGGMLRSATAAQWAAAELSWNTRNCGTMAAALPPAHGNLLEWAEVIYCMEEEHRASLLARWPWAADKIVVLGIIDNFIYRSPELIELLEKKFPSITFPSPTGAG